MRATAGTSPQTGNCTPSSKYRYTHRWYARLWLETGSRAFQKVQASVLGRVQLLPFKRNPHSLNHNKPKRRKKGKKLENARIGEEKLFWNRRRRMFVWVWYCPRSQVSAPCVTLSTSHLGSSPKPNEVNGKSQWKATALTGPLITLVLNSSSVKWGWHWIISFLLLLVLSFFLVRL